MISACELDLLLCDLKLRPKGEVNVGVEVGEGRIGFRQGQMASWHSLAVGVPLSPQGRVRSQASAWVPFGCLDWRTVNIGFRP